MRVRERIVVAIMVFLVTAHGLFSFAHFIHSLAPKEGLVWASAMIGMVLSLTIDGGLQ